MAVRPGRLAAPGKAITDETAVDVTVECTGPAPGPDVEGGCVQTGDPQGAAHVGPTPRPRPARGRPASGGELRPIPDTTPRQYLISPDGAVLEVKGDILVRI